ncbi:hypothetical protein HPB50_001428 [Hyalomma asiaticum]|uniref:Uncharacterized protein n=1 Tax=Hyalomma asiaticum TaxID=266040 RepID=A0ACB7T771_HYAAI|nr:hypothetical protein HPB50_001428 [Hyalomma asiaticum]
MKCYMDEFGVVDKESGSFGEGDLALGRVNTVVDRGREEGCKQSGREKGPSQERRAPGITVCVACCVRTPCRRTSTKALTTCNLAADPETKKRLLLDRALLVPATISASPRCLVAAVHLAAGIPACGSLLQQGGPDA